MIRIRWFLRDPQADQNSNGSENIGEIIQTIGS
jgi:hypothetical protein